ncbi:MAG TPA: LapA family protein [Deltaproteobacteria bacterium]|nr:LapA family protein [Deltaproteobacteria bacterium]
MDTGGIKSNTKLIGIAIAAVLGFIFLLQNFEQTSFQFLFWTLFTAPKWIVVGGTFAIGMAFGFLLGKKKS